jgi:hypothetical protein
MLLMIGGETPETCWVTHKREVINLWNCCILLVELFESYDDARTCEGQIRFSCLKVAINISLLVPPESSCLTSKGGFTHSMPCPCRAAKGLECIFPIWFTQCGRVWFIKMWSVNQTRLHCVNQMGTTHSKRLAARHGRGTAWARHVMCESALNDRAN